ncbi:extensin-like domain-containing protein [Bosea sp. PAMC 26642]|uniref:extensin-like domain-containing protein n=1 Tax=Bosea sp. (strain PAMC 26642) TaxID=1792307 RepID=UPI00076FE410|nr:extensin family protein [Bosea sp. PAMC 26642]AMJ62529.1 hypothetical protein AXW83_21465 [Bosea sp. PAMC 26642]
MPPPRPPDIGPKVDPAPPAPPKASPPAANSQPPAVEAKQPAGDPAQPGESACLRTLRAVHGDRVKVSTARMPADPGCAVVDPVVVTALALRKEAGAGEVAFEPPVTIGCAMALRVSEWLDTSVQPLAQGHFERDIAALRVGGGHECRRRNRGTAGPLSEHSTGQALDIFAFQLGKTKQETVTVVVEKPGGLVQDRFLTAIRQSACGAFNTSLGPGADAAHANHLHVDIQERRSRATRFCQ